MRIWAQLPVSVRAVVSGLLIGLTAANVWPPLLLNLGVPLAATTEAVFLALYLWWASGGGPPVTWKMARGAAFRRGALTSTQWMWGVVAALSFAATIHASIVLLFRLVPFPMEAFRRGYDFSFIPSLPLKWIAVVVSAASAGICEETGFRGYMQQPIEHRHGAPTAIFVSSAFFTLLHLRAAWAPRVVLRITHARHRGSRRDGHWAVRVLVDRYRGRLYRATDHGDRGGSAFPDHLCGLGHHALCCAVRGSATTATERISRAVRTPGHVTPRVSSRRVSRTTCLERVGPNTIARPSSSRRSRLSSPSANSWPVVDLRGPTITSIDGRE
jgi:membrane protease YdiL (CAAX protease family)